MKDDDQCANCGADYADHDYVKNSIDKYRCPQNRQETVYGYYTGGDPRNFHPDDEACSDKEITEHRQACRLWDEADGTTPEGFDGNFGCSHAPFGVGVYTFESEQFFELWEPSEVNDE